MRFACLSLAVALCACPAAAGAPVDADGQFAALQALEARVASVAWRLTSANTDLCPDKGPRTGLTLHEARQYAPESRALAARYFHLTDAPAVMAVAPDSPAERAGLRAGDVIVAVDGASLRDAPQGPAAYDGVRRSLALIDASLRKGPAVLAVQRDGAAAKALTLQPVVGCDYEVQLIPSPKREGSADGRVVSVTTALVRFAASDDELAVVIGHEMAHNVLDRRENRARSTRKRERAADYVGLYLAARAGYDVSVAEGFWRRFGEHDWDARLGIITHPGSTARSRTAANTAAEILRKRAQDVPLVPAGF